ncbi:MAG TPA: hypothetical protein DCL49_13040 [Candidatus Omnitrophica bacterium]|nr:hypothetical protein [Candidatus Omnitrophota bacterium]HCD38230.1 hypothetical protein [Candidatus Omnitrophota bacterium]
MKLNLLYRYVKIIASYIVGYPLYQPDSVSIIVTNKCNLRCLMCDFWKDAPDAADGISLEEFGVIFKDLRQSGVTTVQLTGGEPFLRSDLIEILRAAKKTGLRTVIVNNGTLINEKDVLEFARNVDLVYISLDAPKKEQHEDIRGVRGIFEKIKKSVILLTKTIRDNSLSTRVIVVTTLTPKGIHAPEEMVALIKELGANGIIYNPASSVYYGNTRLKSLPTRENLSMDSYRGMVDRIIALMENLENRVRSNPFYLLASKEFLKGDERYYKFPCLGGGYNGPLIGFDGTVFPCCAWNTPLGNVKEQPFSRIWKSKKAKEARLKIKRRLCPVCYHHTRTFDFLFFAPRLFKNAKTLLKGYKIISRM